MKTLLTISIVLIGILPKVSRMLSTESVHIHTISRLTCMMNTSTPHTLGPVCLYKIGDVIRSYRWSSSSQYSIFIFLTRSNEVYGFYIYYQHYLYLRCLCSINNQFSKLRFHLYNYNILQIKLTLRLVWPKNMTTIRNE